MTWTPHREPLTVTLRRTFAIAIVVGGILAWRVRALPSWPVASLLVLWFSLGGHWVEIAFLNYLRPRLPSARAVQAVARIAYWFVGGVALGLGIGATMRLLALHVRPPSWWAAGAAFIAVELIAHVPLALRRRPNFYNGQG